MGPHSRLQRKFPRREVVRIHQREEETLQMQIRLVHRVALPRHRREAP
jgi:hypothetical protein